MSAGRGRPMSLESSAAELVMELHALTQESMRNEIERARLLRELAQYHAGLQERSLAKAAAP